MQAECWFNFILGRPHITLVVHVSDKREQKAALARIASAVSRRNLSAALSHIIPSLVQDGLQDVADLLSELVLVFRRWEQKGITLTNTKSQEKPADGQTVCSFSFSTNPPVDPVRVTGEVCGN